MFDFPSVVLHLGETRSVIIHRIDLAMFRFEPFSAIVFVSRILLVSRCAVVTFASRSLPPLSPDDIVDMIIIMVIIVFACRRCAVCLVVVCPCFHCTSNVSHLVSYLVSSFTFVVH